MQVQTVVDANANYLQQLKTLVNFHIHNDLPTKKDKINLVRELYTNAFSSIILEKPRMPKLLAIVDNVFFNGLIFKTIVQNSGTLEID
jgi:hypothetical protein